MNIIKSAIIVVNLLSLYMSFEDNFFFLSGCGEYIHINIKETKSNINMITYGNSIIKCGMYIQTIYTVYDNREHACLVEACMPPANVLSGITVIINNIVDVNLFKGIDNIINEKQKKSNSIIY